MKRTVLLGWIVAASTSTAMGAVAMPQPDGPSGSIPVIHSDAIRAETRFLADDLLEGRGTGARGYDIAAAYVASQFEAVGLKAGGVGGSYLQAVPLRSMTVDQQTASLGLDRGGRWDLF